MKKNVILIVFAIMSFQLAFAQIHMELGFNAPLGYTVVNNQGKYTEFTNILKEVGLLPIPFASIYTGLFNDAWGIGIGLKSHTAIIATVAYPSIMGQINSKRKFYPVA